MVQPVVANDRHKFRVHGTRSTGFDRQGPTSGNTAEKLLLFGRSRPARKGYGCGAWSFSAAHCRRELGEPGGSAQRDAGRTGHELAGEGLTFSYPIGDRVPPVTRIDHALITEEIAVLSVKEMTIPGSDHRGFATRLAVQQRP